MLETETTSQQLMPLCVDLDGTLTLSDTLWESCLRLLHLSPFYFFRMLVWLIQGKAKFKQRVSMRGKIDVGLLPYTPGILDFLEQQKKNGRHICLVTAADYIIANSVACKLGIFDTILASDGKKNLSGSSKAKKLVELYGEKGFVYAGNSLVDMKVWQHAAAAIPVNTSKRIRKLLKQKQIHVEAEFPTSGNGLLKCMFKVIRPHQWAKNSLLFVPLILAHSEQAFAWLDVCLAVIAFSATASSIYIINDLFDIEADRRHPKKRQRPFASGGLSVLSGIALIPLLLTCAFLLAWNINVVFTLLLIIYVVLTTMYSLVLKMHPLIDVFTLAALYTLRVIAGAVAGGVDVSSWLLAFSVFFFLSIAFAKRYSELHNLAEVGHLNTGTRGYVIRDLTIIILFGVTSGYLAVMVLILYIQDLQSSSLYSEPLWLWLISFMQLYWISRVWLLSYRGQMDEDPVLFALTDRISHFAAVVVAICFWLAI